MKKLQALNIFCASKQRSQGDIRFLGYSLAFTMAEILISLTIIGIITAITLPALRANINETTWATQRKALYSRLSQAISMMPSLNGYGIGATDEETARKAAQAFLTDGLSKVLKITNICDNTNLKKCGFPDKIKTFTGSNITTPTDFYGMYGVPFVQYISPTPINTKVAAFETANGESGIAYYNPNCNYFDINNIDYTDPNDNVNNVLPSMCVNFVFDMNGRKGPNKVGKDISYITVLSPTDSNISSVIPYGNKSINDYYDYNESVQYCRNLGNDYRLPTIYELAAIHANIKIIFGSTSGRIWSSTMYANNKHLTLYMNFGHISRFADTFRHHVQCVKR